MSGTSKVRAGGRGTVTRTRRPGFYTIAEACRHLVISRSKLRRLILDGHLLVIKYGPRTQIIAAAELERFASVGIVPAVPEIAKV